MCIKADSSKSVKLSKYSVNLLKYRGRGRNKIISIINNFLYQIYNFLTFSSHFYKKALYFSIYFFLSPFF